jgi:DNA-binding GntR family transcriptional regulator
MADQEPAQRAASPIRHRRKVDLVYEHLREQIVNGTYAPGRHMTLSELSAELGLSHMPVREALLKLEREGLLISEPHKGMRVVRPSLRDAREIFQVRCELEGLAASLACSAADPRLADDLETINADFADAYARQDYTAMGTANWTFHRRILQAAGSAQLSRFLEDVWTGSLRYRLGYQLIPGRARHTIDEHADIISAIRDGNAEAARSAARRHIEKAGRELALTMAEPDGP